MFVLRDDHKKLSGTEKAAIILLCLGQERGKDILLEMLDNEIYAITHAMAGLGTVTNECVEAVIGEFAEDMKVGGGLVGNFDKAEAYLKQFMDPDRVQEIMSEVRGPLMGRNMWERFSALNESVIAGYLKGENPQTVAAILSKVSPDVTASVLPLLGKDMMQDVIERMIQMEAVPRDVLQDIEETLQKEFIASAARASTSDPHQRMADIFNKFDLEIFEEVSKKLDDKMPDNFARIKQKMFTFDDLVKLDAQALSRVMRAAEGNALPLALKGAKPEIRKVFLESMPERSRNILVEEMQSMGAVRMREVQEAQNSLVDAAKELAADGTITLPSGDDDDVMVE